MAVLFIRATGNKRENIKMTDSNLQPFDLLTPDEIALIKQRRDEVSRRNAALAFKRKAIQTAIRFDDWSIESGESLTFSTFINSFGYQDDDGKLMYDTIRRIFEAAYPST